MSNIEWTGETWNPLLGCSKISPGCKNCYAIQTAWIRQHNPKMSARYAGTVEKTAAGALNWTGKVNLVEEALLKPLRTRKPTTFFVNSMSDLFHESVPFEFIDRVFVVMKQCRQHTFQVLTKRPERALEYFSPDRPWRLDEACVLMLNEDNSAIRSMVCYEQNGGIEGWPLPNVWLGVSVENQATAEERIPLLLDLPATVRFLSCEPLLGPVDISSWFYPKEYIGMEVSNIEETEHSTLKNEIHWVICGGESGPEARPMHPDWARHLRNQCIDAEVAFFFKQWGAFIPLSHTHANVKSSGTYLFQTGKNNDAIMYKVGKKIAGRLLDGREWNEMPKP